MTTKSGKLTPRPYARLLTMLSSQLIKNNTVALTELAKNSYDADASWVQTRIGNMTNYGKKGLKSEDKPFVEIEDDGDGMSFETIKDSWMNPASPNKFLMRDLGNDRTRKGRIIQGEKGIGRYAVFQIGKNVEIVTRQRVGNNRGTDEITLTTDISQYDGELLSKITQKSQKKPLFFDQLSSRYSIRSEPRRIKPGKIVIENQVQRKKKHGTIIRITELNYEWTPSEVKQIRAILSRLQSPFRRKDFAVSIVFEGEEIFTFQEYPIEDVLDEAMLNMKGSVNKNGICKYSINGITGSIDLVSNLEQDKVLENKTHFSKDGGTRKPECGAFTFSFYLYGPLNTIGDRKLVDYIRNHRTYIYRDDIRIYPYGDRDNDWIKLDIYRGTVKAGYYLSNDQLIGYVNISTSENPNLRDKTSREGLLEQGTAYDDLRLLTLSALNFLNSEYQKIRIERRPKHLKERTTSLFLQTEATRKQIDKLNKHLARTKDKKGAEFLKGLDDDYHTERDIYRRQIEIVEDLAGVGIAVDATSHDLMMVMNRAVEKVAELQSMVDNDGDINLERLRDKVDALHGQIMFTNSLMVGIQPLFRSSRRRNKDLRISDIVKTVKRYYETPLNKFNIDVDIKEVEPPLIIKSSEGVLLQLFINLMDNSVYWLRMSEIKNPQIAVLIDGYRGSIIFADNGPGVRKEDIDYIFEPFFSTKGIQGRGLG